MDRSERLRLSDLNDLRVFLHMPSYSFAQKARILYNHLYFSDLPPAYQDELLRDDFYLGVIKHDKFNPRLIEWLSSFRRIRNVSVQQYRKFIQNLLNGPSEIWRHAYEQEITDAARSMLLTVFSFGGKAAGAALRPAFTNLHHERSSRYRFGTRPEDYRSALREIAGTFIKPFGTHGIEVIDPSVLDLLSAVLRRAPDNAVDIVAGAASFDQIEHIWSFVKAKSSGSIMDAVHREADRLTESVGTRVMQGRRIDLGQGAVGYRGPAFERRLAVIIDMADRLLSQAISTLVLPLYARLQQEWETERPHINDAVDVLRALDDTRSVASDELASMKVAIERALLKEASTGCQSDELRELICVIDTSSDPDDPAVSAARSAFNHYRRSLFNQELSECRSLEQFDGLVEDLELFRDQLGVEVSTLIERVEEAKAEFEENEGAHADHMEDEWKERWRQERATERSVSEMFRSLTGDRS